ncbi:hypothetical protein SAMN04489867_1601 [Pedococcus dokdonensis]|uniref:Uncharacterized protein n=1 Tax=Pedococcus dokdonensis TaxID=443156 RepID=A0A1H0QIF1_9MICO|nr:hypothetical protein [Pedococcus dokdonensis]SDP16496.1 hypothetical protein SAMN04489867_1601 [Pedococcus dokdonensis]
MELVFPDVQGLDDLRTFVSRAKGADPDGAIRLQASGRTLAAYVGVLPGSGLMAEGVVIGLRAMPLGEPAEVDVTVPLAALTDRLAREGGSTLALPPVTVRVPWAAMAPPRGGWERVGAVAAGDVHAVARQGIEEVAQGVPADAGGSAVAALRRQVWGRLTATTPPVPAGGAFAAHVLGFVGASGTEAEVTVWAHGRWTRLSTAAGHVLIR